MSLQTAVRIENLGKRYRIGQLERYRTLRESIQNAVRAPFRRLLERGNARLPDTSPGSHPNGESIWALKDVCFEVKQGEVLGIIGRNGAGKSTLLKVLSRITEPTEGHVEIRGRVSSLLEVGTGFHPELTGRENVFLNGAILGMSRAEIKRKFDQIVAFSGVEKFLDTPVKRYSSGMSVRLAFAVAAHLEPDILVIDEVLAVGDAAFQKKCLGKMGDVAESGRTVLFVSHNMQAVNTLCSRVLLLDEAVFAAYNWDPGTSDEQLRSKRRVVAFEPSNPAFRPEEGNPRDVFVYPSYARQDGARSSFIVKEIEWVWQCKRDRILVALLEDIAPPSWIGDHLPPWLSPVPLFGDGQHSQMHRWDDLIVRLYWLVYNNHQLG